uniref:Proline dehydrogenase n=1 Tax=Laticauda laticaudata TaxID=8630 RepID=A0A8C5RKG4_LATLA
MLHSQKWHCDLQIGGMLHCGARFLHRRLLTLWSPQVPTQKSSSSKTVLETSSKKSQSSSLLNLDDGKVFRLKTKWELSRALLVFFLCSSPWLVQKAPKLLSFTRRILGRRLWTSALRLTLYGQFVAGETHKEIKETLQRLQHLGVRPLLAVPIEEDEPKPSSERWYDKNVQSMITCLDLSVGGAPNPMMQLKVTALMAAELCVSTVGCIKQQLLGEVSFSCLSQEENQHFQKSLRRLNSVAEYAVEKGVRVLVDAEYTYINPALSLVDFLFLDSPPPLCILFIILPGNPKYDTLERLKQDVALAECLGVSFGIKLVRGAYLNKERKLAKEKGYPDPVQPSWEATNESYRRCLDFGLDQVSQVKERFEMIVATHNEASVTHAVQRYCGEKGWGGTVFGQLLGMCDQVSLALGQAGYAIYKSIPYGSVEEVIPYLIRRAHENQSVLLGIRKERDLLCLELWRRILRRP